MRSVTKADSRRGAAWGLLAALVLGAPALAQGQRGGGGGNMFGEAGQVVISQDSLAGLTYVPGSPGELVVGLLPAADFFIVRNISLGGQLGLGARAAGQSNALSLSAQVRVGLNLPLGGRFSVWPRIGGGVFRDGVSGPGGSQETVYGQVGLFVPFLLHPVPHFFLGLGPGVSVLLGRGTPRVPLQLTTTLGGYF